MRAIALLSLGLLLPTAAWATPSGEGGSVDGGTTGTPTDVAASTDGRYVAMTEASGGGLSVFDTRALSEGGEDASVCGDASSVTWVDDTVQGGRFFVGCGDGAVFVVDVDDSTIPPTLSVSDEIVVNGSVGDVAYLLYAPGDTLVFAVVQDSNLVSLHTISTSATGGETATTLGLQATITATAAAIGESGGPVVIARSDGFLNVYDRSGVTLDTAFSTPDLALGTIEDLLVISVLSTILVADSSQDEVWSLPVTGATLGLSWGGGFTSPVALDLSADAVDGLVTWVGESGPHLYAIDSSQGELASVAVGGTRPEGIAAIDDGPVYIASSDRSLRVVTDAPFLSAVSASPTSVSEDEDFTLSFTSTADGDYTAEVGGDGSEGSGTQVGSGEVTADEAVDVALNARDLPDEGANRLFVFVTDSGGTGVDSTTVTLDTPPDAVTNLAVGAGDERLSLSWTATSESDIDVFELYVSDEEFDGDSLPTFDVVRDDDTTDSYPLDVTAGDPSTSQSHSVEGLTNNQTYWMAVRAVDAGGQIGPLSDVISGIPLPTCGAAECANDPGCSSCSIGAAPGASASGLLALLALVVVRRRRDGD